jgi:hypothetical protein
MATTKGRGDCQLLICFLRHVSAQKTNKAARYGRAGRQAVRMLCYLPVFYLSFRFLHNPISSNISPVTAQINKGGLVIDRRRRSSEKRLNRLPCNSHLSATREQNASEIKIQCSGLRFFARSG